MMYIDPNSQYKFVAKTTPNVPVGEQTLQTSGAINLSDVAIALPAENTASTTTQIPSHTATHFQAPEHVQKQTALHQNASGTVLAPGQAVAPGQTTAASQAAAGTVAGQGLTYDGKRMRKSVQRRTVDYNSSVIRFLETRKWFKSSRNQHALQPEEIYNVDVVPPCGYIKNPMNAVTTKFVRTSTNKLRCPIFCVVWTPEGRRLVTGASSGEFTLWNGLTFNFETILQAHDRAVRSMVWSHNDSWLLTGDHGGFVKYWQSNMNNVRMYEAHKDPVRGLSFSPSDNKFASCSDDGLVKVWDFYRCAEERALKGHGADVKCVDWHPSKGIIVSGSKDSQQPVKLWDPKSGNSITTLHCHKSTVMTAKWNSNGNWLVTGSRDHLLKLFDIRMMKELQTFRGHKKEATVVAWHPVHETLFASGGSDGSLMFWLTGVDEKAGAMDKAHEGIVWSLSWHPLGHILCSGSNDHTSKFWARNRPGDVMTDKYNLDIQGSQEDGEHNEEGASQTSVPALAAYDASTVIPGVGLPVTARNVLLPDSRDVDAHLYGESNKDNRKKAATQPVTMSSQFPYPPAFKQSSQAFIDSRPGSFSQGQATIPGLDMQTAGDSENEGYKLPHLASSTTPQLRLPPRLPRPPLPNLPNDGNRPYFGSGPRHGFDFRGPSGPGSQDPNGNFGPPGRPPPNQFMRFPGRVRLEGPIGFGQRGPGGPYPRQLGGPHHRGPHGGLLDHHLRQDGPYRGPRPGPANVNVRPHDFPSGKHGEEPRPHGGRLGPNERADGSYGGPRPYDNPPGQYRPRDGPHGPRDGPNEAPPGQHGPRDKSREGPAGQHGPPRDGQHGGPSAHYGPRDESRGGPPGHHGSRDESRGGPPGHHGPRNESREGPPGHHGPRDSAKGPRGGPPGPRENPDVEPRMINDNGPRGAGPPQFQPSRKDPLKPDLRSPEGDKRGPPETRENFRKRSRDNSPRDSPVPSNHVKHERRASDDAPGILGDYVDHVKEMQRGVLENIVRSAVGLSAGQQRPEIAGRPDRDRHGDRDRKDMGRPGDRERDRPPFDRPALGRREDRSSRDRSDIDRPGDRQKDRPPFGDRGPSHDRHDMGKPGSRPPFERQDSGSDRALSDVQGLPPHEKPGLLPIPDMFLARGTQHHNGPPPHNTSPRDPASTNHGPPDWSHDRRRDHGRFQDARNEPRPGDGPQATGVKPLMSLLDAPPVSLGSPPGPGGVESRGRKRSVEHEFDRPPKRMGPPSENRDFFR